MNNYITYCNNINELYKSFYVQYLPPKYQQLIFIDLPVARFNLVINDTGVDLVSHTVKFWNEILPRMSSNSVNAWQSVADILGNEFILMRDIYNMDYVTNFAKIFRKLNRTHMLVNQSFSTELVPFPSSFRQ
jgi:hypothetical protein